MYPSSLQPLMMGKTKDCHKGKLFLSNLTKIVDGKSFLLFVFAADAMAFNWITDLLATTF